MCPYVGLAFHSRHDPDTFALSLAPCHVTRSADCLGEPDGQGPRVALHQVERVAVPLQLERVRRREDELPAGAGVTRRSDVEAPAPDRALQLKQQVATHRRRGDAGRCDPPVDGIERGDEQVGRRDSGGGEGSCERGAMRGDVRAAVVADVVNRFKQRLLRGAHRI